MSYAQPALSFGTRDFSPGFMDTPESDTLPAGASPDAKNCLLVSVELAAQTGKSRAVIRKRLGARLLNPVSIDNKTVSIDGVFEFLRDTGAAGELLAVSNGAVSKFDGIDTFTLIGGVGLTAGNPVRMLPFRNNAFLSDGLANLRYNGTTCLGVGFIAPTSPAALAIVAGPGVSGTFQHYAVWYDSVMDHESSPSPMSAVSPAFVNQQRQWTKPSGAPPANVDYWRVYVRRDDTNERNFFRVAQVPIGTATFTEAVSDAARTEIGPNPNDNDVPPAFAFQEEYKGFRLGVRLNSSDVYVSKQYDAESQHPKNVFAIGGKGDQKAVQCVRKYGEECLIQKPRRSYRIVGDQLPFQFVPLQSSLGCVSQEAGLEVRSWYYAWDETVGPYRTNLSAWQPLADNRIATVVATVNRQALGSIRAVHVAAYNLIAWIVATGNSSRPRTILAYNYVLDRWLPPMTGFEYVSLTEFTTSAGARGVYFGDQWGRVYEMFSGEVDGVPSGGTQQVITSATASTITCVPGIVPPFEPFYITGNGLAGMPAAVRSPAGRWQWVRIQSNTFNTLTLDTTNGPSLNPVPDSGWTVYIGAIQWYWMTPASDNGLPDTKKLARWFFLQGRTGSIATTINVDLLLDQTVASNQSLAITLPVGSGLVWGVGRWGVDTWGGATAEAARKRRIERSYLNAQFRFYNYLPNQPVVVTAFRLGADPLGHRTVASG